MWGVCLTRILFCTGFLRKSKKTYLSSPPTDMNSVDRARLTLGIITQHTGICPCTGLLPFYHALFVLYTEPGSVLCVSILKLSAEGRDLPALKNFSPGRMT